MNIFTALSMAEELMQLAIKYEPQIESDVKDILAIIDRIRNDLASAEGQK